MSESKKRLGDVLLESGRISPEDLNLALKLQKITGKRLGQILIEKKIVTEDDLLTALEMQMSIPRIYLDFTVVDEQATYKIPESLANKHNIIPIRITDNKITIVTSDPFDILAVDDVRIATGLEVEQVLDASSSIKSAIKKYYSKLKAKMTAKNLADEEAREKRNAIAQVDFEEDSDAPAVKLLDAIIENGVRMKASDIHIEPLDTKIRVRCRVDGTLQNILDVPKSTQGSLMTRIKIMANLNIAERRLPQDGRIITKIDKDEVDLRVSILPTINGEKVVIRILSRASFLVNKKSLGLSDFDLKAVDSIMEKPYGIVLVTGPTGSGKSTTLYTLLNELNSEAQNIITVEDPVEYMMSGISQVNVNTRAGLTFASGLRSILRQDPDVVMVGEVRDAETAEIAIRASITGHIVLSTLHTNDAPSTVARLKDMGIEPYLLATSLNGVIAQRLVRRACRCAEEYYASDYEKQLLGINKDVELTLIKAKGCALCQNIGYKGRIGIYEVMELKREIREAVNNGVNTDELRDIAIKNGMRTLKMSCREHVLEKRTTLEEMLRVTFLKE